MPVDQWTKNVWVSVADHLLHIQISFTPRPSNNKRPLSWRQRKAGFWNTIHTRLLLPLWGVLRYLFGRKEKAVLRNFPLPPSDLLSFTPKYIAMYLKVKPDLSIGRIVNRQPIAGW
jgi:hypothetical protein